MKDDPSKRIMTLAQASEFRLELKKRNRKLVLTNGCFDLLHRGHAEYLNESRMLGDALVVLINSDRSVRALKGDSRPLIDEYSRAYMLASLRSVDGVVIFDGQRCANELAVLKPDIYVKGGDYSLDTLDSAERQVLLDSGAVICFKKFVAGLSTSGIVKKIKESDGE